MYLKLLWFVYLEMTSKTFTYLCCGLVVALLQLVLVRPVLSQPDKLDSLIETAHDLIERDVETALIKGRQALRRAEELNDERKIARAAEIVGLAFWYKSKPDSALYYLDQSLNYFRSVGNEFKQTETLQKLGRVYNDQLYPEKSLELYLEAAAIIEKSDNFDPLVELYIDIANIYDGQGLKGTAMEYYHKSRKVFEQFRLADSSNYVRVMGAIAATHAELRAFDSAAYYFQKARSLAASFNNQFRLGQLTQNIGSFYLDQELLDSAFKYYQISFKINSTHDHKGLLTFNHQGLAAYYDRLAQRSEDSIRFYKKSVYHAEKLIEVAKEIGNQRRLLFGYERAWDVYRMIGDFKKAFEFHVLYDQLRYSILDKNKSQQILELREKYDTEEKENRIAQQNIKISEQNLTRNGLVAGLIFLAITAGLIYRNERIKTRKNRQIESLLREIHHRVKNNLQVISSLLNMQARGVDDDEVLDTIKEGQSRVKAMSLIHQKLYQTESVSEIDFQDYISELAEQLKELYLGGEVGVNTDISAEEIRLDLDTAIPLGLILNELISNAYKYAFEGVDSGKIAIKLKRLEGDQLKLEFSDNGRGLPVGLNLEKAKSLGLKLVNILTKQLHGTLSYSGDQGTKFTIVFSDLRMGVQS